VRETHVVTIHVRLDSTVTHIVAMPAGERSVRVRRLLTDTARPCEAIVGENSCLPSPITPGQANHAGAAIGERTKFHRHTPN
jgi:hypothetical protein